MIARRTALVPLLALALVLAPGVSRADRQDWYALLHGGPSFTKLSDPVDGEASTSVVAGRLGVSSYYGFTDTLHLGVSLTGLTSGPVTYTGARVTLLSGSRPSGDLTEKLYGAGLGLLAHYRYDTGELWAPFAQLELGGEYLMHKDIRHEAAGVEFPFEDVSKLQPTTALQLGLEYRFRNVYSASLGFGVRANPAKLGSTLEFQVPLTLGFIFR